MRKWIAFDAAEHFVETLRVLADVVPDPAEVEATTRDVADDYLVALAREQTADYIVTGDNDLLEWPERRPPVLTPAAFVECLRCSQPCLGRGLARVGELNLHGPADVDGSKRPCGRLLISRASCRSNEPFPGGSFGRGEQTSASLTGHLWDALVVLAAVPCDGPAGVRPALLATLAPVRRLGCERGSDSADGDGDISVHGCRRLDRVVG